MVNMIAHGERAGGKIMNISGYLNVMNVIKCWVGTSLSVMCLSAFSAPPVVESDSESSATVGEVYNYQILGHDPDGTSLTYSLTISLNGMTLDENGLVTWLPTSHDDAGVKSFKIRLEDEQGEVKNHSVTLKVTDPNNQLPAYTQPPITSAVLDTPYFYSPEFVDADGDELTYSIYTWPESIPVSFNDEDGSLSWTPQREYGNKLFVRISANDGHLGKGKSEYTIIVADPNNSAPQFDSDGPTTAYVGEEYTYTIQVSDADHDPITLGLLFAPEGMTLNSETNTIHWTPASADSDNVIVKIGAKDPFGGESLQVVEINVVASDGNAAPNIISSPAPNAVVGENYIYNVIAEDIDNDPLTYTLIETIDGMSVDSFSGVISWVPTNQQIGTFNFTVEVSDGRGGSDTQNASITVGNLAPTIVSIPVWEVRVGQSFNYQIIAEDPENHALIYANEGSDIPITVSDILGSVSWLPTLDDVGMHTVRISVTDSFGAIDIQEFILNVLAQSNRAPFITSSPVLNVNEGDTYTYPVSAEDPDGDVISYDLSQGPEGMGISPITGLITWQPSAPIQLGMHPVSVLVKDIHGASSSQNFLVEFIGRVNTAPDITSEAVAEGKVNALYVYDVDAVDSDGDDITFRLNNAPESLTIHPQTGVISGIPESAGSFSVEVEATDQRASDIQVFTLVISEDINSGPTFVSEPITVTDEHTSYAYDADAEDDKPGLVYALQNGPDGLTINPETGVVSWFADEQYVQSVLGQNAHCDISTNNADSFEPILKWRWTGSDILPSYDQVMMTPLVAQASDDNGDGVIDERDIPDVIFSTFSTETATGGSGAGLVRIISGEDGTDLAAFSSVLDIEAYGNLAVGDIDNDGEIEILAPRVVSGLYAFELDGTQKWYQPDVGNIWWGGASIADLDADGTPEILAAGSVLDNEGNILWTNTVMGGQFTGGFGMAADINLNGVQEVIFGGTVFDASGNLIWQNATMPDGLSAIGNFDLDDAPEIAIVHQGLLGLVNDDGQLIWQVDIPGSILGGAPTVADVDGDGALEIGVAGETHYIVFNDDGSILWQVPVVDASSQRTGSSVFDFDNDGDAEIVYADETTLHVYDGETGNVIFETPHSSGTTYEYPVIVDIDRDNRAEIIIAQNDFGFDEERFNGIAAYEDINDAWADTRSIWNQFAYHIDNINEDGTIPANPIKSWQTHNTFRLNRLPISIDPVIKWEWNGSEILPDHIQSLSVPLVAQTSDDNSDGVINELDIPDVIFIAVPEDDTDDGVIRIISGDSGEDVRTISDEQFRFRGNSTLAVGDIDNDGIIEIIGESSRTGGVIALNHDGSFLWEFDQDVRPDTEQTSTAISIADIDEDGLPEILAARTVINSDGTLKWIANSSFYGENYTRNGTGSMTYAVDFIAESPGLEFIVGPSVFASDGQRLWSNDSFSEGTTAVGDIVNQDGVAEMVVVRSENVYLLSNQGDIVWGPVRLPTRNSNSGSQFNYGGPPTIADMDGDGLPEIGVAGADLYTVINHDGSIAWSSPTQDRSHITGSTVFDFNGDGQAEIVYADEIYLRGFNGVNGDEIFAIRNDSTTSTEYPIVVDIDNDNHADIVVSNNTLLSYSGQEIIPEFTGIRVYEGNGNNWVDTRSIWNQHVYHIDNVNADGTIPIIQEKSWLTHNTFRLNTFPNKERLRNVDLRAGDIHLDESTHTLSVVVSNIGIASYNTPFVVDFYRIGDAKVFLGSQVVEMLDSGDSIAVAITVDPSLVNDDILVQVNTQDAHLECQSDNNHSQAAFIAINVADVEGLTDEQAYLLNVHNVNEPPEIQNTSENIDVLTGGEFFYHIAASDTDLGDQLTYQLIDSPAGMTINSTTGEIRWRPQVSQAGPTAVTVSVQDMAGEQDLFTFDINVNIRRLPPSITSEPIVDVNIEDASSTPDDFDLRSWTDIDQVAVDGNDGDATWFASSSTTAQQSVNGEPSVFLSDFDFSNAQISGTFRVSDQSDDDGIGFVFGFQNPYQYYLFSWEKGAQNGRDQGISLKRFNLNPDGSEGSPSVLDTDPNGEVLYKNEALPWEELTTYSFTLRFRFGSILIELFRDDTLIESFSVFDDTFIDGNFGLYNHSQPQVLYEVTELRRFNSVNYGYNVEANDPDGENNDLIYSLISAPDGMEIDAATGQVTWNVDRENEGPHNVIVRVTDSDGLFDEQQYILIVDGGNTPPTIISDPVSEVLFDTTPISEEINIQNWTHQPQIILGDSSPSSWSLISDNEVRQLTNSVGSAFLSDFDFSNGQITGAMGVATTGDDDNIGFVFGYQNRYQYYIMHWKQGAQSGWDRGISLRVFDLNPDGSEDLPNLVDSESNGRLLYKNDQISWDDNAEYDFSLSFVNGEIAITLSQGDTVIDAFSVSDSTFDSGLFGFFNHSQSNAFYKAYTLETSRTGEYEYQVVATDRENDELEYSLVQSPSSMAIDTLSGLINWQPQIDDVGQHDITVRVEDEFGGVDEQRFELVVSNETPVIVSQPLTQVFIDQPYAYDVNALDPNDDDMTYSLTVFPGSMTIDSVTGLITWNPTAADLGVATITVRAEDPDAHFDEQTFDLLVEEPAPNIAPEFITTPILEAFVGQAYLYLPEFNDADGDNVQLILETVPVGFVQSFTSQLLVWTPSVEQLGLNEVVLIANDGNGGETRQVFTINVLQPGGVDNNPPIITGEPVLTAFVGTEYQYAFEAREPDGDQMSFSGVWPEGARVFFRAEVNADHTDGFLTWTPTQNQIGQHQILLRVLDEFNAEVDQQFTINVIDGEPNFAPTITSVPIFNGSVEQDFIYQVTATDPEGDEITISLLNGPSTMSIDNNGLVRWAASDISVGSFPVTVAATDEGGAQSTQSFTLNLDFNGSPTVISTPVISTLPGELYSYPVIAVDPENESLTYSLINPPANMSINNEGLISWTALENQIGIHSVTLEVRDPQDNLFTHIYNLQVVDNRVPNRSPEIVGDILRTAQADSAYQSVVPVTDPDGDILTFTLNTEIEGLTVSDTGDINWLPTLGQAGEHILSITASDGEFSVTMVRSIVVDTGPIPLNVLISAEPRSVQPDTPVLITVVPRGGLAPLNVNVEIDGQSVTLNELGQAYVSRANPGRYNIVASVTDGEGETVIESTYFTVAEASDSLAPLVSISAPLDGDEITNLTDVVATVDDYNLASYHLYLRRSGQDELIPVAEGGENVVNNVIASLDPTSQLNGLYDLILQATDYSGQTASSSLSVNISGDLKVGNFSFSVVDLEVPLAGIPIRVTRTYDSRRKSELLDFGYGWTVGYQDVRVEESRVIGSLWTQYQYGSGPLGLIPRFCIEPVNGAPKVIVTLPDGEQEEFNVSLETTCSDVFEIADTSLRFVPVGDTQSTLEVIGDDTVRLDEGSGSLVNIGDFAPVNPDRYRLTTQAGFVYEINQHFGIEQVITPNGHTITYTQDGIFHSGGKSITFERDSQGKITRVIDPASKAIRYTYDSVGDLKVVTDQVGAQVKYTYNRHHGLLEIIDPLDRKLLKNIYDDSGKLIAQEDNQGNVTNFDHNLEGRTSTVTDRDGRATTFAYDDEGNVLTEINVARGIVYNDNIQTDFDYDDNGNQIYNAVGGDEFATTSEFDENNNQEFSRNALGHTVLYEDYNRFGQEGRIVDERGNAHDMHYDTVGNLLLIEGPEYIDPETGNVTRNTATNVINTRGLPESTTDMNGHTTRFTYYPEGHEWEDQKWTESTDLGGTTTFTYDDNLNVKTETRQRSVAGELIEETQTYDYDDKNRLTVTSYPDGSYTETEYDLVGNAYRERDRFGNWTQTDYDLYGRVELITYPDGSTESNTYTDEGNLLTSTNRLGHITRYQYDDFGRQWRVHFEPANGEPATFTETQYTPQGWVQYEWDENRNLTEYTHDNAGRRTSVIRHGEGGTLVHQFNYYDNGELRSETDALDHTTTYVLNELDQRIETQFHNGTAVQSQYDSMGTRIRSFDQNNRATRFDHDDLGRLVGVQPEVSINGEPVPLTRYEYDEVGNKLTQVDAKANATSWTYDYFGRVTSRTLPMLQQEITRYDDITRTVTHTDFNGQTITTQIDNMGRTTRMDYDDGQFEIYEYYPDGLVSSVETQQGITTYAYYAQNWLQTETRPDGSVLAYQYDAAGNRTQVSVTHNGSTSVTDYTYDDFNRLETVADINGITTYTYDDVGNMASVIYPNGLITEYRYNTINQLTRVETQDDSGSILGGYTYDLGATGRRELITEDNGRVTDYVYDNLYRLTEETITDATNGDYAATYEYDWVGNRTYETVDGVSTAYTYDNNDRLTQTGGTTYVYDDNGNTLTETLDGVVTTYEYDVKNTVRSVTKEGVTTEYTYHHNRVRNSKTENGVTTQFIFDENRDYAQVLREVEGNDITVEYTYGHDLINQQRNDDVHYYQYDGLGSTRALSDGVGAITDTYDYEAFGEVLNLMGETENSYLFTGEQFDASLNQYYLRARYYDQGIGRFTQMDTWMGNNFDPVTLHKYLYANADPGNMVDPSGNFSIGSLTAGFRIQNILGTASQAKVLGTIFKLNVGSVTVAGFFPISLEYFKNGLLLRRLAYECYILGSVSCGDLNRAASDLSFNAFAGIVKGAKLGTDIGKSIHDFSNGLRLDLGVGSPLLNLARYQEITQALDAFTKSLNELLGNPPNLDGRDEMDQLRKQTEEEFWKFVITAF